MCMRHGIAKDCAVHIHGGEGVGDRKGRGEKHVAGRETWPAVSHSCRRTTRSSRYIVFDRKSMPIVACGQNMRQHQKICAQRYAQRPLVRVFTQHVQRAADCMRCRQLYANKRGSCMRLF